MTLTLRAVSLNSAALTQPITARFGSEGGTIGRSDRSTMALPDPERYISRQHGRIIATGTGFAIQNIGSSNTILVRNQTLGQGETTPLKHGDSVRIGGYELEVFEDLADGHPDAVTIARARVLVEDRATGPAHAPLAQGSDAMRPLAPDNPFAGLVDRCDAQAPSRFASGAHDDDTPRLPPDFDPLRPRQAAANANGNSFEDLIPRVEGASIDEIIGRRDDAGGDPLDGFLAAEAVQAQPEPRAERLADRVPELLAAFTPPRAMPMPGVEVFAPAIDTPPTSPPAHPTEALDLDVSAPPARLTSVDAQALWEAFCSGAGMSMDAAGPASPEAMAQAGALLRLAVEGTLQLMQLRSSTRYELHAPVTMIRPRENNPLKFSPDASAALERLLQPATRGFLPGTTAMSEAMNELVGHTIGTMAGMRAALEGVLGRFAPGDLELKLSANGVLDRVLPMTRKARLWELYLQHHGTIREAAQEDFHALFGKAFLAAYEQQVDRLRRERAVRTG